MNLQNTFIDFYLKNTFIKFFNKIKKTCTH